MGGSSNNRLRRDMDWVDMAQEGQMVDYCEHG